MREGKLRSVLLVKAIEDTDGTELLIPEADRVAATREARRDAGGNTADELNDASALPARAQRMLAARADVLLPPVVARHPFVETVSNLASGPAWVRWVLVGLSLLCGGALSALDGPRRIDIVSLPLLALVAWNLVVYVMVIAGWSRVSLNTPTRPRVVPRFASERVLGNLNRFVNRSAKFDARLAEALSRFAREWAEVARPLLVARASRVFHLCAAAAGLGLIAGLYLRGITLDYRAGWESTFIDAYGVHMLISIIYGPASAFTGIPIPDVAHLETIRWRNGVGGERAASWMHLLTATVAIFIVVPRLVLVVFDTLAVWRRSLRAPLPPSLTAYFRKTFGAEGALVRTKLVVMPYAYEPSATALAELRRQLAAALGENGEIELRPTVRYGDEEALGRHAAACQDVDLLVLLMNLAATPEDENHGAVVSGVGHWFTPARASGRALVMLDEGPYVERMGAIGGPAERMAERRRLWQTFVEKHGLKAYFITLTPPAADAAPGAEVERLRPALLH